MWVLLFPAFYAIYIAVDRRIDRMRTRWLKSRALG